MPLSIFLVGAAAVIAAAYYGASTMAAKLGGGNAIPLEVAQRFAHTLVPIALAYAFAHYFTLVVFEGQQLIAALSDPWLSDGICLAPRAARSTSS